LFGNFVRILAEAIFAEASLTAFSFSILAAIFCALLFATFVQLVWTVCDGGFDNHFESARSLILLSVVADLLVGFVRILFRF